MLNIIIKDAKQIFSRKNILLCIINTVDIVDENMQCETR